ncbi:hypothetical protein FTV88_0618 [Heliorestis convoluta]|uniref:Uncharacterized protein n=1 Tax=Heliorestis convoluta TaxID=356322 RepID=A0A5Q2MWQ3_9FIRM|nr:DUF6544 family protein [Heliorestis convoluta]QGG46797.1 hypothetical protein FTV88_0618 [Heliorestis convoluta]
MMKRIGIIGFGVIMGIFVIVLAFSAIANATFNQKVHKEIVEFLETQKHSEATTIQAEEVEHLPEPVKKWLRTTGVINTEPVHTARSRQSALVRLDQDKDNWMPLEAQQYFTIDKPGFLWTAKFKVAPFIHIVGRDRYHEGKGHMLIKFQSFFNIADAKGYEMDQGSLVRYLAEIVWVPTAALEEYIAWQEIDENSALATMTYQACLHPVSLLLMMKGMQYIF